MRVLEDQKTKLEAQAALKKAALESATEMRKVETGLAALAKAVEKDAYALTGQPPVQVLTLDQLQARVAGALTEAVAIARQKGALEGAGVTQGGGSTYRPPPDLPSLLAALTSPDWLARAALPANLDTLRLALQVGRLGARTGGLGVAAEMVWDCFIVRLLLGIALIGPRRMQRASCSSMAQSVDVSRTASPAPPSHFLSHSLTTHEHGHVPHSCRRQVRTTAAELERVRRLEGHEAAWGARAAEAGAARLVHGMNVQSGALAAALQAQVCMGVVVCCACVLVALCWWRA